MKEPKAYDRILKSSSIIGGAQGINMLIGMVRIKFIAVLIGPVGIGLVGTYRATTQLVGTVAGLGLQSSAVRDIAAASGNNDPEQIGRTVLTLRRMCWLTGSLGSFTVALFSPLLSLLTFGNTDHALSIAFIGLTILFTNIQGGQTALIQGMRRIGDLAKLNVYGVATGSVTSVAFYAWLGMDGIAPAIVGLGLIQVLISWLFARKIEVPPAQMTWRESFQLAGGMIKLGLSFMWSGLLVAIVGYATRAIVAHEIDLAAVGIFSAAFGLSGWVVNFILGAMGADYYPSLTAINDDNKEMCKLVNQQTEIGLLLATPGILATIAFAPLAIDIFYTSEFSAAANLLRWFALGCLGRVISWPMGFVMLAKGASRLFALTQTFANSLHIGLIWSLVIFRGIEGSAIAFCLLYVVHTFVVLHIARKLIGFSWSSSTLKLLSILLPITATTFIACKLLPDTVSFITGALASGATSFYCLRALTGRLHPNHKICRIANKIPLLGHQQ